MSNPTVDKPYTSHRVQWKIALPLLMVPISAILGHLDSVWLIGAGKWDDLPVTSAQGLSALINGPVSEFLGFRTPMEWMLIGVFWIWVGWLADRRIAGNRAPLVHYRWIRKSLYALGFALGALLLSHPILTLRSSGFYSYLLNRPFWSSPRVHLLGREITALAEIIWGTFCCFYFGNKLLGLTLKRPPSPG